MTDDLFPIQPSYPPELTLARERLAKAQAEYDECDAWQDESGEAIPREIRCELENAKYAVKLEEEAALSLLSWRKSAAEHPDNPMIRTHLNALDQ